MNYRPHIGELGFVEPLEPVLFLKPDSALATDKMPFFIPDFAKRFDYEAEIVIRIAKLGKNIAEKFAYRYYDAWTVGLDMTARDLQDEARQKSLPWSICKGFDQSAIVGDFLPVDRENVQATDFHMDLNGRTVQKASTADMIFSIDRLISYASRFFTLKTGDLIFTGTPYGVGPVHIDDVLEAWLGENKVLNLRVK